MAKTEQKIFGKIVKVLRASNFLTLKAAGAKANICTSAFYNFETELRAPNYSKQIKIAEAFRIPKELFDELWNLTKGLNENLNKLKTLIKQLENVRNKEIENQKNGLTALYKMIFSID